MNLSHLKLCPLSLEKHLSFDLHPVIVVFTEASKYCRKCVSQSVSLNSINIEKGVTFSNLLPDS